MTKKKTGAKDEEEFQMTVKMQKDETYLLRLYVTGMTQQSILAIDNLKRICEEHLKGRYNLEVIDLYKTPALAAGEQIIASPTLVKKLPLPLRRIIGDMSNKDRVLFGLDMKPIKNK
jgi:circadian clock protein KaiB